MWKDRVIVTKTHFECRLSVRGKMWKTILFKFLKFHNESRKVKKFHTSRFPLHGEMAISKSAGTMCSCTLRVNLHVLKPIFAPFDINNATSHHGYLPNNAPYVISSTTDLVLQTSNKFSWTGNCVYITRLRNAMVKICNKRIIWIDW